MSSRCPSSVPILSMVWVRHKWHELERDVSTAVGLQKDLGGLGTGAEFPGSDHGRVNIQSFEGSKNELTGMYLRELVHIVLLSGTRALSLDVGTCA